MASGARWLRWLMAVVVSVTLVAAGVARAPSVEAFCDGPDRPTWWSVGWAEETVRWSTTCDDLGDYYGKVRDAKTDGYCSAAVLEGRSGIRLGLRRAVLRELDELRLCLPG